MASLLDLQQQAGNRAVTGFVAQRAGPPVATAPFKPVTDFDTMKLSELNDYADLRPDWSTDPALPKPRRKSLIDTLAFARAGQPQPLGACGGMLVPELEATKLTPPVRTKLRNYTRGVAETDTVAAPSTNVLADALRDGEAIGRLESALPKAALHHTMGKTDEGKAMFPALVSKGAGEVDRFASYFKRSGAYLEAANGADIDSYLLMVEKDSKHPDEYIGKLPGIHNYHRFLAAMLDTLASNLGDKSRKRPLLLILHSGSDHNGAFHRDVELNNLVKHPRNLAIMVEGAATLEALGGAATDIAKKYGQKKRIQQLMIAGHGSPQSMDMAGKPDKSGKFPSNQAMDLQKNKARTEKFLKGLVANMETGPDARIVLNACLTAADEVSATLSKDPATAKAEILNSLKNSPSLAAKLQELAPGRTVEGNVSSVPAGKYSAEDAMGNPTGVLHQIIPSDPLAASTDRAEYVEKGQEAEGCMRAAVALWAVDKAELLKRVEARRKVKIGDWDDRVIHVLYDLIAAEPDNVSLMNVIANNVAGGLSEFDLDAEQIPRTIYGLNRSLTKDQEDAIVGPLYPHAPRGAQLAFDQVWMIKNTGRRANFMAGLDGFATTRDASPRLDMPALKLSMAELLPVASAKTPTTAQMKLALWSVSGGRSNDDAAAFLKENAGKSGSFTMPAGTTVESLTGSATTENAVLTSLGLLGSAPAPDGSGVDEPPPNMDLDGDGMNETFVRSLTRTGMITAFMLNVRSRPDITSPRLDAVRGGRSVDVIGESGKWYMVDLRGKVGFVHRGWVRDRPVA